MILKKNLIQISVFGFWSKVVGKKLKFFLVKSRPTLKKILSIILMKIDFLPYFIEFDYESIAKISQIANLFLFWNMAFLNDSYGN
jgi:hypothetical protein